MADIGSVLQNLVAGVFTGVVTGAISVRFALRRFRAERTWERKVAAYTEIFDALYDIQRHAKMQLEEIEEGTTFVEEYKDDASRKASQGYDAIRRAAIKGTFVVGQAAAARLERLVATFETRHYEDDVHEELSADLNAATTALVELVR